MAPLTALSIDELLQVSYFFAQLLHEAIVDSASEVHAVLARRRAIQLKHEKGMGQGCSACGTA